MNFPNLNSATSVLDTVQNFQGGAGLLEYVSVATVYGPTIKVSKLPQGGGGPGVRGALLDLLKPKLSVKMVGLPAQSFAPYGDPGVSEWPTVKIALIGGGVVAGGLMLLGLISLLKA